jgi:DNA-binding CsgD family transcriptional regulator
MLLLAKLTTGAAVRPQDDFGGTLLTTSGGRRVPLQIEDVIHEATLDVTCWSQLLRMLAEIGDAMQGYLVVASDADARVAAAGQVGGGPVRQDTPVFDGLLRDAAVVQFVRLAPAKDGERLAALVEPLAEGQRLAIVLRSEEEIGTGRLGRLNALAPSLARAMQVSAKIAEGYTTSAVTSLSRMGFAAAALTRSARIIRQNERFASWLQSAPVSASNHLLLRDPGANAELMRALGAAAEGETTHVIPTRTQDWQNVLHLLPADRSAHGLLSPATAIALVTPTEGGLMREGLVEKLFDLTPSEALIANRLIAGQTLEQIAASTGRSILTVRTQAKRLLAKTGAHRQAEFVRLVARLLPGL